jgi:hypothetical protein
MLFDLSTALNNELVDIPAKAILHEMNQFDKEELSTVRFNQEVTKHFDLLIATAIGFQMKNNVLTSNEATYY